MTKKTDPAYYQQYNVQCYELAQHLPFNQGQILKYVWRCGTKPGESTKDDLSKGLQYCEFELERTRMLRGQLEYMSRFLSLEKFLTPEQYLLRVVLAYLFEGITNLELLRCELQEHLDRVCKKDSSYEEKNKFREIIDSHILKELNKLAGENEDG